MDFWGFLKKKLTLVTHSGTFHADDVFAVAALKIWARQNNSALKIIRSRDPEVVSKADIAVDVGGIYDPDKKRFDHHQREGAGNHENGIPYASFGLVWKHFGKDICGNAEIANFIEKRLVLPADAWDNGVKISETNGYYIYDYSTFTMICDFNPTWEENQEIVNSEFDKAVCFAEKILNRNIYCAEAAIDGEKFTNSEIKKQNYPEILILDKYVDWESASSKAKNTKFVVYKHRNGKNWCAQSARESLEDFGSSRALFPSEWRGLRDDELRKASDVKDSIFCTNGGWFCTTDSKESAILMAKKALGQAN